MFINRKEVDNNMYKACKSTCHEWKDQVENYKEDIVVKKEKLMMKKEMKNKEILRQNQKIKQPTV